MKYRSWFQCIDPACGETYDIFDVVYRCRKCGELLEVAHDEARLAPTSGEASKKLSEQRFHSTT